MKHQDNNLIGKGVRNLCAEARSWCTRLEEWSSTSSSIGLPASLARACAPVLGGAECKLDARGLVLLLICAIRQLIDRLLAEETLHREILDALPAARKLRTAAVRELYNRLKGYRLVGLSNCHGPVIPPGELPRRQKKLAAFAATVRSRLDCEELKAGPWVRIQPGLRQGFDQVTSRLAAATADIEKREERSRETRETRSATMNELRGHVTAARSLYQALCNLQALDHGKEKPCATR